MTRTVASIGAALYLGIQVLALPAAGAADVLEPPAPEQLVQRLGDADWTVRETAQARLAVLGEAALDALLAARGHTDPEVRLRVEQLLYSRRARVEALLGSLDMISQAGAFHTGLPEFEALVDLGTLAHLPLVAVVRREAVDGGVIRYNLLKVAFEALHRVADPRFVQDTVACVTVGDRYTLGRLGELLRRKFPADAVVGELLAWTGTADEVSAANALELLRDYPSPELREVWERALSSSIARIRIVALGSVGSASGGFLGGQADDAMVARVGALASGDPNREVRREAVSCLESLGRPRSVDVLLAAVYDPDLETARRAVRALGVLNAREGAQRLRALLARAERGMEGDLIRALGRLEDEDSASLVAERLDHRDRDVRLAALEALGRIPEAQAEDHLLRLLDSADPLEQSLAAAALGRLGSERALPGLGELVLSPQRVVRQRALAALGDIGDERALPLLVDALRGEPATARCALAALARMESKQVLPEVRALLVQRDPVLVGEAVDYLVVVGDREALPDLCALLRDPGTPPAVERRTVRALGVLGDASVVPLLHEVRDESRRSALRQEVQLALVKLGF